MISTHSPVPSPPSPLGGWVGRLRATGFAFAYCALAPVVLMCLILVAVGLSTSVVGVGLVLLLGAVPLTQVLATAHRAIASRVLGTPVTGSYLKVPGRPWRRLMGWSRDPARWRDWAWTWVVATIGWVVAWVAVGLTVAVFWFALYPLLYALTPEHLLDAHYIWFVLDSQQDSYWQWVLVPVSAALWWFGVPALTTAHAMLDRSLLGLSHGQLEQRLVSTASSRADVVARSAGELRRIERDLHDGPQARLASVGLTLGMVEDVMRSDPDRAYELVGEARRSTQEALQDLRTLVRGIHPPVLADRGLVGATRALAADLALPVHVHVGVNGRLDDAVESAVYFASTECLANVVRHAHASNADIDLRHDGARLVVTVDDDGVGGADIGTGSGLAGLKRRLATLDGVLHVRSSAAGTIVTMEVPCGLSSPRTTSFLPTA